MSRYPALFSPVKIGALQLRNRIAMASLTRNRSVPDTVPNAANVEYYSQRAKYTPLILTEGTLIEPQGTEWPNAPGIWSEDHVAGWKKVTEAVHARGGQIMCQLWHLGRINNNDMEWQKKAGKPVQGPSDTVARGGKYRLLPGTPGHSKPVPYEDPRVVIPAYINAAKLAKAAGFDGVELHSANGYLMHQFIDNTANKRTDEFGGSVENRCRLPLEVLKALVDVWGADRVGIKLNPTGGYNDMGMTLEDTKETFTYLIKEICGLGLAYVQLVNYVAAMDPEFDGKKRATVHDIIDTYGPVIREFGKVTSILNNGGLQPNEAEKLIEAGKIDVAVFGAMHISNPDFAERVRKGLELNTNLDFFGFYNFPEGNPGKGYHDYPFATENAEKATL